ncbi:DUF357 domain-containing protein [uncultured Methanoregula sp.]|uniref:DUF357 domain-containing protein n=1 Tax=uncultured Methanoregula sp. TaxID=1005933 RepID=UPI002AAA6C7A|nr:DUF357 domain-containing protein [uncultured Methanoregula sp.]
MRIAECQKALAETISLCTITGPDKTPLGRAGASILLMARSYESDGRGFFACGDPVNALASFWYAFGWLHFGITYGLLAFRGRAVPCLFEGPFDQVPADLEEKCQEKTGRYARLLDTARSSVICAPDASTPGYAFAKKVESISAVYAGYGNLERESGRPEKALACYSYGHGWLDAGVTAGLFTITANRDIFTV